MPEPTDQRAAPPQPPQPTPALQQALADQQTYREARALTAHRSLTRGLLLIAAIVLFASIAHAGLHNVFLPGWWRHW